VDSRQGHSAGSRFYEIRQILRTGTTVWEPREHRRCFGHGTTTFVIMGDKTPALRLARHGRRIRSMGRAGQPRQPIAAR
jgi:hypothetical protein